MFFNIKDIDPRLYTIELRNPDKWPSELYSLYDYNNFSVRRLSPDSQTLATSSDFSVVYKINSKGLRDKEYSYEKPSGVIRVLAFGDSQIFGAGIPYGKRFTDLVEDHFDNLEIINFGVPATGVDAELLYFILEGLKYSPDCVILFINSADTFRSNPEIILSDESISFYEQHPPSVIISPLQIKDYDANFSFIMKNSYFLSYRDYQLTKFILREDFRRIDEEWFLNRTHSNATIPDSQIEYAQTRTIRAINKFGDISRAHNITFILVNIDYYYDLGYLDDLKNLIYVDLTESFLSEAGKHSLEFTYDPHFNEETNSLLADELMLMLEEYVFK